jgi:hypothetical protein
MTIAPAPDPLHVEDTDDEPWRMPDDEPCHCDREWFALLALIVVALVIVAVVRWR